jgi:histidine ammonia-lyase
MIDKLDHARFVDLCLGGAPIELDAAERERIEESRRIFEQILKANPGKSYYGINTGVGAFLNTSIPEHKMGDFQENLIINHACGIGQALEPDIVRGIMLHMILNLKKGYCGIRLQTLELLIEVFNRNIIPVVPAVGSLGASGDLVPQAHIALALIGKDRRRVLRRAGLEPAKLQAGEAIALLNGTSLMTSILAFLVFHSDNLIQSADVAAALTVQALGCGSESFQQELQRLRPHPGQLATAQLLTHILPHKQGRTSGRSLQGAYSLRCVPQVHGAFRETLARARDVVDIEINSFGGNPWISRQGDKPEIRQASGNFHGQILAHTADTLAIGLCTLSAISERRIDKLLSSSANGLPLFLARDQGLDTGLMIAQYSAAALVSESRTLSHPASVDSIPVSAGQEDFVSMGAWAARKAWQICRNTEYVIAIEILCSARALDLQRQLSGESILAQFHQAVRRHLPPSRRSRAPADDIEKLCALVRSGQLLSEVGL